MNAKLSKERVAELRTWLMVESQWRIQGKGQKGRDKNYADLLAVLDLAEKARSLIEAVEGSNPITIFADINLQGRDGGSLSKQTKTILRAALELNRKMKEGKK
jgi:hypothetical protein